MCKITKRAMGLKKKEKLFQQSTVVFEGFNETTNLFETERSSSFFVCVTKVPLFLTLSLHVRWGFDHIALKQTNKTTTKSLRRARLTMHALLLRLTRKVTLRESYFVFTWRGTVALDVCRWARVSRSTRMRTPFESITSFTFFYIFGIAGERIMSVERSGNAGYISKLLKKKRKIKDHKTLPTLLRMSLFRNRMSLSLSSLSVHCKRQEKSFWAQKNWQKAHGVLWASVLTRSSMPTMYFVSVKGPISS